MKRAGRIAECGPGPAHLASRILVEKRADPLISRLPKICATPSAHPGVWASGDYPAVAAELIPGLGPELVRACGVRAGAHVLDVAAGSGNAAIPAAEAGAIVTA